MDNPFLKHTTDKQLKGISVDGKTLKHCHRITFKTRHLHAGVHGFCYLIDETPFLDLRTEDVLSSPSCSLLAWSEPPTAH